MKIHVTECPQTPYTTIKYCCAKEIIKSTLQEYQITYSPISQPLFNRLAIELTLCMMRIFATYATNFFVIGQSLKVFYKKKPVFRPHLDYQLLIIKKTHIWCNVYVCIRFTVMGQ